MKKRMLTAIGLLTAIILISAATSVMRQEEYGVDWETISPIELQVRIDNGLDITERTRHGSTPLMSAVQDNSNPEVIKLLLDAGAAIDARNEKGWTPLMFAARYSNPDVIELLLDAGSDPAAEDRKGNTAWDLIQENEDLKETDVYWELNDLRFE